MTVHPSPSPSPSPLPPPTPTPRPDVQQSLEHLESLRAAGIAAVVSHFHRGSVVVFDRDLRYLSAAGLGLVDVGLSAEMLEGRTIDEVFPPAVAAIIEPWYRRALAGEETAVDVPFGGRVFLQQLAPLRSAGGVVIGGMGITEDVTEARQADRALRESEDRFRSAFELAPIGKALVSLDGRYDKVNAAMCAITGYPESVLCTLNAHDITHPDDVAADAAGMARLRTGQAATYEVEKRYLTPSGRVVWASTSVSLARSEDGAPLYFIGQVQDISERREHERVLADERRRLRDAQSIGRVGSWEEIVATQEVTWSDSLFELYGVNPTDFHSDYASAMATIHPDDVPEIRAVLADLRAGAPPVRIRYRVRRADDGSLRWFDARGDSIRENGVITGIAGAVTDVTEQVLAATELERARDAALEASRAKSAFLAAMSHEIRTPLNAVIGLTDIVLDTELDPDQREYLSTVHASGESLVTLINDILDWSKFESGALDLEQRPFDVQDCVEGAVDLLASQIHGRDLQLLVDIDADCPVSVLGDVTRVRQILVNLVGNAVKFTAEGRVVVGAQRSPDVPSALRLTVADTGIGIPAEKMDRLFRDFSQVDDSTTRTYGGTGLGLAISQRLAQAMGGVITVESTPGSGSVFTVDLPLPVAAVARTPAVASPVLRRRVLVIEDDPVYRRILGSLLDRWNLDGDVVADDDAARALLATGRVHDVALIDTHRHPHLPSGARDVLAAAARPGAALPTVLLTSLSDRHRSLPVDAGIRQLTKPVRAAVLRHALAELLAAPGAGAQARAGESESTESAGEPPGAPEGPVVPAARVLLVEDNLVNRTVAQLMLERLGYAADVAVNGAEAVAAAARTPYDLVLMDVEMPVMDGLEATRRLRSEPPPGPRPWVIALTASALVEDREQCAAAGMDDYLSKPVHRSELAAVLARARAPVASGQ